MDSVIFLVLRRMRAPLIMLIAIYAVSVLGLALIPGVDAQGKPAPPMSFFHAFYFISYTATTIGFGELPNPFSEAQRMWTIFCIYLTVIGWSYSIVTILGLVQDKGFQSAFAQIRFSRTVRRIGEPFYLVCGCGETGTLVCSALDRIGTRFVIVERSEQRVQELDLLAWHSDAPALAGDARLPQVLCAAGLQHPKCRGVLAVTNDEEANLAVAIAVRLLHPGIPVLARARSDSVSANMASFGTDHIINPFKHFAAQLALAVHAPDTFRLEQLLTGITGEPVPEPHRPPRGDWIVCGYGRFGHAIASALHGQGQPVTLITTELTEDTPHRCVRGASTEAQQQLDAGIIDAVGIVAGTDNDINNLSIAVTARELNPKIFVVMRQNHAANTALFDAFVGDFALVPSRLIAQECLAIITTPLLSQFLDLIRKQENAWAANLLEQIESLCGTQVPERWGCALNISDARAAYLHLMAGRPLPLATLLRDAADRSQTLPVVVWMLRRGKQMTLLPARDTLLQAGDALLMAGAPHAREKLKLGVQNANALDYLLSGREAPGGWIWQRWAERK
ncbi:NAD-binding protein [Niveibacterium sp. 24ML]|uniref:potassium channel family protein n=1 Tax=Niveibacterium sp. 24ML TaxID=2985512 RepID=UPI00226F3500|nr:potassium channel protein [Niveibacterium sp. 24ML]MCX9158247.1 NAD-binding protein [Niveibacterium sp. 24ML]